MRAFRQTTTYETKFLEVWALYPKKQGKAYAQTCWSKLKPSEKVGRLILLSIKENIDTAWRGRELKFIPDLSTFLNQKRWEDYVEVPVTESKPELKKNEHHCRFCPEPHIWICPDPVCTAPDEMPCPAFLTRLH